MLTHRGFSAWITVGDEERLPEYLVAVDSEEHRVSCWVPGEEGKKFTVWWQDHGGGVDTCSYISLDGITVPGRFLLGDGIASRSGARADQYRERPFKFMKIPDNAKGDLDSDADVGTIVLKIKRIRRVEDTEANTVETLPASVTGKRKAGDLCVGLGPLDETAKPQYPRTWKCLPYDITPGNPTHPATFVSFVFRYRTQEFLETQGIAEKKKVVPVRAAPKAPVQRHVSASAILPPPTVYKAPSGSASPSAPKRARTLDQAALLGHGPAPITTQGAASTEVRRTSSYYRPQTYEQTATSPATISTPTASTSAPTPTASTSAPTPSASTDAATTPASSLPSPLPPSDAQPQSQPAAGTAAAQKETPAAQAQPEAQPAQQIDLTEETPDKAAPASPSSSTTSPTPVPSTATPKPSTTTTNGKGQSLFMLPRSASQGNISSPPQKAASTSKTKPAAAGVPKSYSLPAIPMGTTGFPVQMYPYYPFPGTHPTVPPTGAFPYYAALNPYAWMSSNAAAVAAALGYGGAAKAKASATAAPKQGKASGSGSEPPPMGSLAEETTTPSPSADNADKGKGKEKEKGDGEDKGENEGEEPLAKRRRTESASG